VSILTLQKQNEYFESKNRRRRQIKKRGQAIMRDIYKNSGEEWGKKKRIFGRTCWKSFIV